MLSTTKNILFFAVFAQAEIISDIDDSEEFQYTSLSKQGDQFWKTIEQSVKNLDDGQAKFFDDADSVLATLDSDLAVHAMLKDSVADLREAATTLISMHILADETITQANLENNGVVTDWSMRPVGSGGVHSFLSDAYQRIMSTFTRRSEKGVNQRQQQIIPLLAATADNTGDMLRLVRTASSKAFDVLKYDIYNRDVPKTPQAAKDLADQCVDLSSKLRKRFMDFVLGSVRAITDDTLASRGAVAVDVDAVAASTQTSGGSLSLSNDAEIAARSTDFNEQVNAKARLIQKASGDVDDITNGIRQGYGYGVSEDDETQDDELDESEFVVSDDTFVTNSSLHDDSLSADISIGEGTSTVVKVSDGFRAHSIVTKESASV